MKPTKTFKIWYDQEGDFLEMGDWMTNRGVYVSIGNECFHRIDEKTGNVVGLAIFNFRKRFSKPKELTIPGEFSIKATKKQKSASKA